LKEQADSLPRGSAEWKTLEKRISHLEPYRLGERGRKRRRTKRGCFDESGKKIGERHSVRKPTIERRRGRPEEFTIKPRAAYEEKLAHPESLGR